MGTARGDIPLHLQLDHIQAGQQRPGEPLPVVRASGSRTELPQRFIDKLIDVSQAALHVTRVRPRRRHSGPKVLVAGLPTGDLGQRRQLGGRPIRPRHGQAQSPLAVGQLRRPLDRHADEVSEQLDRGVAALAEHRSPSAGDQQGPVPTRGRTPDHDIINRRERLLLQCDLHGDEFITQSLDRLPE
jgi:hypothetical protein